MMHIVTAIFARIGTSTFAVAVFDATFVIVTFRDIFQMMLQSERG